MKKLFFLFLILVSLASAESFEEQQAKQLHQIHIQISDCWVTTLLPTGSMEPGLNEKYFLLVKKMEWKSVKVGDVIIFRIPRPYIYKGQAFNTMCHRVVQKSSEGTFVLTKGDHNDIMDSILISEDDYIGTVVGSIRRDL